MISPNQSGPESLNLLTEPAGRSLDGSIDSGDFFFIRSANSYEKVFFRDILFIEARQNYMNIHLEKGKLIALLTIKSLEEQLPNRKFLRVHKSYIVSLEKVSLWRGNEIFIGASQIPVGKNFKDQLQKLVNDRFIGR